jgi:hypothetical protein
MSQKINFFTINEINFLANRLSGITFILPDMYQWK